MKKQFLLAFCLLTAAGAWAQPIKRVLIEKFTSAGCGNCPDGTAILENLTANQPNLIWVSHHAGWIPDVMGFKQLDTIATAFTSGAPTACIDRVKFQGQADVATLRPAWLSAVQQRQAVAALADLTLSGNYDSLSRTLSVSATVLLTDPTAFTNQRLHLFIVEDSVTGGTAYNQANYFNNTPNHAFYGKGNPVVGYAHRHVTRATLTGAWGDAAAIPAAPVANTPYTKQYTYTLPTSFRPDRVRVVAFVANHSNNANQRSVDNANQIFLRDMLTVGTTPLVVPTVAVDLLQNSPSDVPRLRLAVRNDQSVRWMVTGANGQVLLQQNEHLFSGVQERTLEIQPSDNGLYYLTVWHNEGIIESRAFVWIK